MKLLEKIENVLLEGFYNVWNQMRDEEHTTKNYNKESILFEKVIKNFKKSIQPTCKELEKLKPIFWESFTGIITYNKKFQVIDTTYTGSVLATEFKKLDIVYPINLCKREQSKEHILTEGVIAYGDLIDGEIFIRNLVPKSFCCKTMEKQFLLCFIHSLNCSENVVRFNLLNDYHIVTSNHPVYLEYCPFCGTKLNK